MEVSRSSWLIYFSLLVISTSLVQNCEGGRSRLRMGNYPKREETELTAYDGESIKLKKIGEILKDLSVILDKMADNQQTDGDTSDIETTPASTDKPNIEDMETLKKLLASRLAERESEQKPDQRELIADPHPRSTEEEDEDVKFKRVLTKWMQRDLDKDEPISM